LADIAGRNIRQLSETVMSRKSGSTVTRTAADLQAMMARGEVRTDWKVAAKKPLPSGSDADDAMEESDRLTTKMPKPQDKGA
jgi:hypothetical protein